MIAVSIGRGRHKMMIAEHRHLAEQGAELVELRLDYVVRAVSLKRLLKERPCPVIITCRREQDGGKWERTEQERAMLLRSAIAEGVDYVDLEEDIAGSVPRFGKTKRIVSYHNFEETPDNLQQIHDRCASHDADIVKIATAANNPRDNLRMLQLIQDNDIPTVAFCMGEMGISSRILAGKFGAPFTYASFHKERALAPGQLTYQEMRELYRYEELGPGTEVYGVIADPVGHSLSPLIHNLAFRERKMDRVYLPFRVPAENLGEFIGDCRRLGVAGLSVTIPHKEAVMPFLTEKQEVVEEIGVANTVVFDGGKRSGYNTDYSAAIESLKVTLHRGGGGLEVLTGRNALILGAGGAAQAVAYALAQQNIDLYIAARKIEKAEAIAQRFRCHAVHWDDRHKLPADILVNCTPVGMHPHVNDSPYETKKLSRSMIVFDTIYNPEQTLLIKAAKELGCMVVTGVEMFVRQAVGQFKLFTGEEAPDELMREAIRKHIGAVRAP